MQSRKLKDDRTELQVTSGKGDKLYSYSRLPTRLLYFFFLQKLTAHTLTHFQNLLGASTEHSHLFSLISSLAGQQVFRKACIQVTPVS